MHVADLRIIRGAAWPTALAAVILVTVSALVVGSKGAIGAGLGAVIVGVFFTIGMVAIASASRVSPQAMMQVALFTYLIKILALFGLIVAFKDAAWFNPKAFAVAIVILTLVWISGQIRAFSKEPMLYVDPTPGED